jgi:hypothetical protein
LPAAFCIGKKTSNAISGADRTRKVLACPKNKYDDAKILKCCPFGEELLYPLPRDTNMVRCVTEETRPGKVWTLRMNGFHFKMQESFQDSERESWWPG